jgi:hypothetical protein
MMPGPGTGESVPTATALGSIGDRRRKMVTSLSTVAAKRQSKAPHAVRTGAVDSVHGGINATPSLTGIDERKINIPHWNAECNEKKKWIHLSTD